MAGIVAVVGRPNVGKSTLFNRLVGERRAVVEASPGVTRDRLYAEVTWGRKQFTLIDTGGLEAGAVPDDIGRQVQDQVARAIQEADLLLCVVDSQAGVLPGDAQVADSLRRSGRPILLVANKVDDFSRWSPAEFYQLGLGDAFPVSAAHGLNIGELLDAITARLPEEQDVHQEDGVGEPLKIAVVGRPNVGKSSLVNRLLGEEKVIVSDTPGTTRDAVDSQLTYNGQDFVIIDTAGLRRRSRIQDATEYYSILRARESITRAHIVLLVLDATAGVTEQDKRIGGYIQEAGRGVVLTVNKWDLVPKETGTLESYRRHLLTELYFLNYAYPAFVSARTGQRVLSLLTLARDTYAQSTRRIPTPELNDLLQEAIALNPMPWRLFYSAQVGILPPTFVLRVDNPEAVHFSHRRYLEHKLREAYGFAGTPLRLKFQIRR